MGSKGIGEIGIVGTAAAVANAVYNATGVRVRDLPITPAKLVGRLWVARSEPSSHRSTCKSA
jgi:xanthine dehydrogenase YagR molybdenum-binding subunit